MTPVMLSVMSILGLIATHSAYVDGSRIIKQQIIDFDELVDELDEIEVYLINPNVYMNFLEKKVPNNDNAIYFEPTSLPDSDGHPHEDCGSNLGIEFIDTDQVFCNLISFGMKYDFSEEDDEEHLYLILRFKSDSTAPLELEIPLLVHDFDPSIVTLNKLRRKHRVGVKFTYDNSYIFDKIEEGKAFDLDFEWLEELFNDKIYENTSPVTEEGRKADVKTYITRPIVMSQDGASSLIYLVNKFTKGDSSDEDNN